MIENLKSRGFIILLIFILIFGYFSMKQRNDIRYNGVVTKCIILSSEGHKGGKIIEFSYKYKGKTYQANDGGMLGVSSIGKQFFIKLLPSDPKKVTLLDGNPVPSCLLNMDAPEEGWKVMPVCK